jgi:oligopeptide transport system substrate-binding protein
MVSFKRAVWLGLLAAALLSLAACSRSREEEKVARETVPIVQTVIVRETVVVERVVEVTPTPDLSRQPVTLRLSLDGEPFSIDPALASDGGGLDVVESLFLGLTNFDAQGNVVPELATGWSVSDDGLRWTFTLRDDVTWVNYRPGSGVTPIGPVTADDVVFAVQRACDPRTGAELARSNFIIAGCQALHMADLAGRDPQQVASLVQAVGVEALDDVTVQFTLLEPAGYFPAVAGLPINRPLHQPTVEQYGERWTEPGNIVSNGPYVLAGWFHGDSMALARNPQWPGWQEPAGNVERIELAMLSDAAALERYQAGELDSVVVPPAELPRVQADPALSQQLSIVPTSCSEYYGFNNSRPPLNDALVRKALSAAIDRRALVETATRGGEIPANTFAPPMIFGHAAGDPSIAPWALSEAQGGWGYAQALAQAQAWLAEAGYSNGQGLPTLTLLHNNADGPAQVAQAVAAMWRAGLGVEVVVQSLPWPEYWRLLNGFGGSAQASPSGLGQETGPSGEETAGPSGEELPHVWRMGFCGDLPDQHGWLHQEFSTEQGVDRLRWAESANAPLAGDGRSFNQLTAAARQSADPAERQALYREAERILNDTAAGIAPLYYYSSAYLTQPHVQRTYELNGNQFATWRAD